MPWTKLSDDYSDDCWELSDAAYRLHTEALNWSNRKLLDCLIPKDEIRLFAKHPEAVPELLDIGWWVDRGDDYEIVHHACYQRPREDVLAQQKRSRVNGQKGGRPPGPPREQQPRKRPKETQKLTQPGSDERTKPQKKPRQLTQLPTQGVRPGEAINRGTALRGDGKPTTGRNRRARSVGGGQRAPTVCAPPVRSRWATPGRSNCEPARVGAAAARTGRPASVPLRRWLVQPAHVRRVQAVP